MCLHPHTESLAQSTVAKPVVFRFGHVASKDSDPASAIFSVFLNSPTPHTHTLQMLPTQWTSNSGSRVIPPGARSPDARQTGLWEEAHHGQAWGGIKS